MRFFRKAPIPRELDEVDLPVPHCDMSILHAPGECVYCDKYPYAQALRDHWQINFTGEYDTTKLPCPSTLRRTDEVRDLWGGNRPRSYSDEIAMDDNDEWSSMDFWPTEKDI